MGKQVYQSNTCNMGCCMLHCIHLHLIRKITFLCIFCDYRFFVNMSQIHVLWILDFIQLVCQLQTGWSADTIFVLFFAAFIASGSICIRFKTNILGLDQKYRKKLIVEWLLPQYLQTYAFVDYYSTCKDSAFSLKINQLISWHLKTVWNGSTLCILQINQQKCFEMWSFVYFLIAR